jgi:hypothetical protein
MSRKSRRLPYKPIIAIYCEGDSEKAYFDMLKRKYHSANVHPTKVAITSIGSSGPELLKKASSKLKRLPTGQKVEQAYVVFDRDALSESDLIQCEQLAKTHKITILFSSINLEIWILMHFKPVFRAYTAKELNQILSGKDYFNTDYRAFKGQAYDRYLFDRIHTAKAHGDLLQQKITRPWYRQDPFTNIHQHLKGIFDTDSF